MTQDERELREEIVAACRQMNSSGINQGTSGNISARWADGLLITPIGEPYDELAPEDMVFMNFDGTYEGDIVPSSEWRFHLDIIKSRQDVNAVVHAHPTYCTALAIKGLDIPAVHYMIAACGGPTVRCAPYATYGTEELSQNALEAMEGRTCCLLANHGMIATGPTLKKAMWLAIELETLARQYVVSLQIGGPNLLSDAEISHVIEKFKTYGPRPKSEAV